MVNKDVDLVYLSVDLKLRDNFVGNSYNYVGEHILFTDMDFVGFIEDDADYAYYLDIAYDELEVLISIYFDYSGDLLADLFDIDCDEIGSLTNCEESKPLAARGMPQEEPIPDAHWFDAGLEDEMIHDDRLDANLNTTNDDEFLSKLFPEGRYSGCMDKCGERRM
ncbi:hypothetical protein LXL04_015361 [Taraxacum kok-saghyz]